MHELSRPNDTGPELHRELGARSLLPESCTLAFSARSKGRAFAGLRTQTLDRFVLRCALKHRSNLNDGIAQTCRLLKVHGGGSVTHVFLHGLDDPHELVMR